MSNKSVLEVDQLEVRYGAIEAIKGISLRVEAGEIVTIIGGNGAGNLNENDLRARAGSSRPSALCRARRDTDARPSSRVTRDRSVARGAASVSGSNRAG